MYNYSGKSSNGSHFCMFRKNLHVLAYTSRIGRHTVYEIKLFISGILSTFTKISTFKNIPLYGIYTWENIVYVHVHACIHIHARENSVYIHVYICTCVLNHMKPPIVSFTYTRSIPGREFDHKRVVEE